MSQRSCSGKTQNSPKKGRFYECHQHFLRTAHPAVHDPTAPLDAQGETTCRRASITKDVPILRIDHVSIKGKLLGVWQALYRRGVLDFKEINGRLTIRMKCSRFIHHQPK